MSQKLLENISAAIDRSDVVHIGIGSDHYSGKILYCDDEWLEILCWRTEECGLQSSNWFLKISAIDAFCVVNIAWNEELFDRIGLCDDPHDAS